LPVSRGKGVKKGAFANCGGTDKANRDAVVALEDPFQPISFVIQSQNTFL
jgi:hypothetical protein